MPKKTAASRKNVGGFFRRDACRLSKRYRLCRKCLYLFCFYPIAFLQIGHRPYFFAFRLYFIGQEPNKALPGHNVSGDLWFIIHLFNHTLCLTRFIKVKASAFLPSPNLPICFYVDKEKRGEAEIVR